MKTLTASGMRERNSGSYLPKLRKRKGSRQKEAILRVLQSAESHPTAIWIYDEVRRELPNISLGTVYRNLRQLLVQGEIAELEIAGDCRRFSYNTRNHYHGKCDRCGEVFDIDESASQRLNRQISRVVDFQIFDYRLEFYGLCRECREN